MDKPLEFKGQANRLGRKLADGEVLTQEEASQLEGIFSVYQDAQSIVRDNLHRLGYPATVRVKTLTLTEKLQRLQGLTLVRIDDIAGARIVVTGGRTAQNVAIARVVDAFTVDGQPSPRVKDRRETPSHGYRAVHVLAVLGDCRVEIQV